MIHCWIIGHTSEPCKCDKGGRTGKSDVEEEGTM